MNKYSIPQSLILFYLLKILACKYYYGNVIDIWSHSVSHATVNSTRGRHLRNDSVKDISLEYVWKWISLLFYWSIKLCKCEWKCFHLEMRKNEREKLEFYLWNLTKTCVVYIGTRLPTTEMWKNLYAIALGSEMSNTCVFYGIHTNKTIKLHRNRSIVSNERIAECFSKTFVNQCEHSLRVYTVHTHNDSAWTEWTEQHRPLKENEMERKANQESQRGIKTCLSMVR